MYIREIFRGDDLSFVPCLSRGVEAPLSSQQLHNSGIHAQHYMQGDMFLCCLNTVQHMLLNNRILPCLQTGHHRASWAPNWGPALPYRLPISPQLAPNWGPAGPASPYWGLMGPASPFRPTIGRQSWLMWPNLTRRRPTGPNWAMGPHGEINKLATHREFPSGARPLHHGCSENRAANAARRLVGVRR